MKHTQILLLIALLGAVALGSPSLRGATITVTEVGDGLNVHTNLRQALFDANDGDTIVFDPLLGGRNLPLAAVFGQLVVDKNITISWVPTDGYPSYLGVDAQHTSRVFYISPGKTVTISGLTIINGSAPTPNYWGGGIYNDHADLTLSNCVISGNSADQGVGGGVFNDAGTLTLSNCTISGNSTWYGGGISHNWLGGNSTLTITNSTLNGNSASFGGGVYNEASVVTVSNSTFSNNSATYGGGGIYSTGTSSSTTATLAIANSTLNGNSASFGGGIVNDFAGTATVASSTFSGNSAGGYNNIYNGLGGGIFNAQTLTISNSTFSDNSAITHGGAIHNEGANSYASTILKIGGTILNAGSSGGNIYNNNNYYPATVTSLGYNLSSDDGGGYLTATGDQISTDPRLGPLQNNGGPTFTHLPASNSPAIDAGDPALYTDQRGVGFVRIVNNRIDVGAIEVQVASSPSPTPTPAPRPHGRH